MRYIKAIVAGISAGATAIGASSADGHLTAIELIAGIGAGIVTAAAVYAAPANRV